MKVNAMSKKLSKGLKGVGGYITAKAVEFSTSFKTLLYASFKTSLYTPFKTLLCTPFKTLLSAKNTKGQGTTEYAILVGVLAVIAMIAIGLFKGKLQGLWDAISSGINGL